MNPGDFPAVQFLVAGIRDLAARQAADFPGVLDLTGPPASASRDALRRAS